MFTTGRIVFMIFFVIAFVILMFLSYRKDAKSHQQFYKGAGMKVAIWGFIVVVVFVALRYLTSLL